MFAGALERWQAFRSGTVPCEACGLAVSETRAEGVEPLEITVGKIRTGFDFEDGSPREVPNMVQAPVGRCPLCAQIHAAAVDLVAANWLVRSAIGDPSIAVYRVELALYALDAIGVVRPEVIDAMTGTSGALARTVEAMARPGARAMWTTVARQRRGKNALSMPPCSTRWEHVDGATRRALNEAFVQLHVARTEKPVPVAAIDDDGRPTGCGMCGIGSVMALPSQASRAWAQIMTDPEAVGAPSSPDPIDLLLCPRCDRAVDQAHAVGPSAMRVSILDLLGADFGPRWDDIAPQFSAIGWAGLPAGTPPNDEPWGHIDLGPLRDELARLGKPIYGDYPSLIPVAMPDETQIRAAAARMGG